MPLLRVLALALLVACSSPRDAARTDSAAGPTTAAAPSIAAHTTPQPDRALGRCDAAAGGAPDDTLCWHAERELALEPGGRPFRLVADARGARADSMRVTLRIVRDDTTWHGDAWSTSRYGAYDATRPSADSLLRRTAFHLNRLVDLGWAVTTTSSLQAGGRDRERMLLETIAYGLKESELRARHDVPRGTPLPAALNDSLRPDSAALQRARTIAAELRDRPAYRYHAGGELTSAWAWGPDERGFVRVYECC